MDLAARKRLNLAVLRRHDPDISDILDQSAHAVFYKFAPEKQSWDKMGFEGVVFLTRRHSAPYFGLYLLNRQAIENYSLLLTDFEEIKMEEEFIIYQTKDGEACALWLFEEKDRERVLKKIVKLPSAQTKQAEQPKVDIMHMLQRATLAQRSPETFPNAGPEKKEEILPPPAAPASASASLPTGPVAIAPTNIEDDVKAKLLRLLTHEKPAQEPVLASAPLPKVEAKEDLVQLLARGMPAQTAEPDSAAPPTTDNKGDLLQILSQGRCSPMKGPDTLPIPGQPALTSDREPDPGRKLFDMLKGGPTNPSGQYQPISSSPLPPTSVTMSPQPVIQFPPEQLTKPFHPLPAHMQPSPSASPNKAAALLQTLQGGTSSMRGYISAPPPPPLRLAPSTSTPSLGHPPPLLPQETLDLTQPEIDRRFSQRPLLSKPEFIQQYLNIVQHDIMFLDALYENYRMRRLAQGDRFLNGVQ
ncbi:hypothetical protein EC973_004670 [Apophysomyces ossiformis]|uniref:Uncharacterized protein n=1 Tax=Apophysomyces ossiformis TaxID=679940 RepID=A0A8H7BPX0_9FUNG|nr:hypothetical protein EC973_004670 [Apophysomyces ossiformis]